MKAAKALCEVADKGKHEVEVEMGRGARKRGSGSTGTAAYCILIGIGSTIDLSPGVSPPLIPTISFLPRKFQPHKRSSPTRDQGRHKIQYTHLVTAMKQSHPHKRKFLRKQSTQGNPIGQGTREQISPFQVPAQQFQAVT
jgi:hypothetical protein